MIAAAVATVSAATTTAPPALSVDMLVVFGIIAVALVLFVWEPVPIDITAIGVMVALIVLEPWTGVDLAQGLSGFSSSATIAVLGMFVLSEGIRRTGLISVIGSEIADRYGDSSFKQLVAVLGLSGGTAGFINNTPVVAVMIPMVSELSDRTGVSPSKLLMPISFAAMMGGMLTLVGTSTNLLASDIYDSMGAEYEAFSMFEFTTLGLLVLVVGCAYLLTIGVRLTPERVKISEELTDDFEMAEYLTEVVVEEDSQFIGQTVDECLRSMDVDADIVQFIRGKQAFTEPLAQKEIRSGDVLVLRTDRESLTSLIETQGLGLAPDAEADVGDEALNVDDDEVEEVESQQLAEVVITPDSSLIGETLETLNFRQRYDATVLAIRRGGRVIHARMDERRLRGGDTLLIQASADTFQRFANDRNFVVAGEFYVPEYRKSKLPIALGIVALVVGLAGAGLAPIAVAALGGMVAMVATGCLRPSEVYEAVDWNVIFLLAGLIPLGIAMEATGGAAFIAGHVVSATGGLDLLILLGVLYLLTAVLTNIVSNNASVVLMIPVSVDIAVAVGGDPLAFALAVTFAASTAFMTPVGYQTNLMVYGPGGYRFTDYMRVGGPLQLLLTVVTVLGIHAIWGVA
ncbi:SLC13 family permease [Natranaeroarchaeum aerophilus]|uniref:SLC13 family permease n=1 Tax=Natranaeroarchaeum aerophilus TaxID=2917711 RepID=A0AAE3FQW8_9EURY|nr:SLC13 family permease [Natranaeroarchaeum aerophilus]MCL9813228.1 SLC13 family permease [Natranaeroarchaeum aerophilus]